MSNAFDPAVTAIIKTGIPEAISIKWLSWARSSKGTFLDITFENARLRIDRGRTSIGVALLHDGARPIGVLYSSVAPNVSRAKSVDWSDVARRALEHLRLHHDHRDALAKFLAAHAGPALEQLDDMNGTQATCWGSAISRLRDNAWKAPVFDLSTGRTTRDLRDFSPVRLAESPTRLTTSARVRLDLTVDTVNAEDAAEEVRLLVEPHAAATVAWPKITISQGMIEVDRTISLEDVFRIRSACGADVPSDFDLKDVATTLASSRRQDDDKYLGMVESYIAALETKWRESRTRTIKRAGKPMLSPVYGGSRIPKGASFGGYDAASVKRVLRARLDDIAEHKLVGQNGRERRPERTEDDPLAPSAEMLLTLHHLGIAEVNAGPDTHDWRPTRLGRMIAGASKAHYRRATAARAIQSVLARALDINRDPDGLYLVQKLVLFGSYLRKGAMVGDVDLGVVWKPAIDDANEFRKRSKQRHDELNRDAGDRFHRWMFVDLSLREVQNRLRGRSPIIQLSDWEQINGAIRERERSLVLIDAGSLVPNAEALLRELESL